jgi:hypothetical protein
MRRLVLTVTVLVALQYLLEAQVPQPFPRPRDPQAPARPAPAAPLPGTAQTAPPPAPAPAVPARVPENAPSEASLGVPLYANAQFITSYDAGRNQRYYLFGSAAGFAELVKYYQAVLKTKGTLVFETPATHTFEMGKFDEKTMAFPTGVTIKDYTWGGSAGYLNPNRDGKPERFASIIQIVPPQPGPPR